MLPAILPVERYPLNKIGVVHPTCTDAGGTKPIKMLIAATAVCTSGTSTKGIIIIGFNTTGSPNSTISLILKSAGTIPALKSVLSFLLFLRQIAANRQSVEPLPPINANTSKNVLEKIGALTPAAMLSVSPFSNNSVDTT